MDKPFLFRANIYCFLVSNCHSIPINCYITIINSDHQDKLKLLLLMLNSFGKIIQN